jgi:hypothetical protein
MVSGGTPCKKDGQKPRPKTMLDRTSIFFSDDQIVKADRFEDGRDTQAESSVSGHWEHGLFVFTEKTWGFQPFTFFEVFGCSESLASQLGSLDTNIYKSLKINIIFRLDYGLHMSYNTIYK